MIFPYRTFNSTQEDILFGWLFSFSSPSFDQTRFEKCEVCKMWILKNIWNFRLGWSGLQIKISCFAKYRKSQIFSRRRGWRCQVCKIFDQILKFWLIFEFWSNFEILTYFEFWSNFEILTYFWILIKFWNSDLFLNFDPLMKFWLFWME